jgi:putative NADPH-quinone reductase
MSGNEAIFGRRILIINGNPSRQRASFSAALVQAYYDGAIEAGHMVRVVRLANLAFDPILHEGYHGVQPVEPDIMTLQADITWAQHVVLVYPMWQFGIPALMKGFCERTFTPGFAYTTDAKNPMESALLRGRSARLIQTMGMPQALYELIFRAHGGKAFKSLLSFCGFKPVRATYLGMVEQAPEIRAKYLARVRRMGSQGK